MQTILRKTTESLSSMTSTSVSTTSRNETRIEKGQQVLIGGLANFYTRSEVDTMILDLDIWGTAQW